MTTTIATIDATKPAPKKPDAIRTAHMQLVADLAKYLTAHGALPHYPVNPAPQDHEAINVYLRAVTAIMGRWLYKIGREVSANALCAVDLKWFAEDTFAEPIEGWATDEIEKAAQAAADEAEDRAAPSRPDFARLIFEDMARMNRVLYGSKDQSSE